MQIKSKWRYHLFTGQNGKNKEGSVLICSAAESVGKQALSDVAARC